MKVENRHSRTIHLDGDDEALALIDAVELAAAVLSICKSQSVAAGWPVERVEKVEGVIEQVREIK